MLQSPDTTEVAKLGVLQSLGSQSWTRLSNKTIYFLKIFFKVNHL